MKFSFAAFFATVGLVIVSGIASFVEGTLTSRRVTMGFINHAGMWGDLLIMSVVSGFVFPYLSRKQNHLVPALLLALAATALAHFLWWNEMRSSAVTGHMFGSDRRAAWYQAMSIAGWLHVIVMTCLLAILFVYVVSPVPKQTVVAVSLLVTVHVVLATVQPGWYCTGKLWTWQNFVPPLAGAIVIWGIALFKMRLAGAGA